MNAFLCICRQHNVIFDHCMFDILGEAELPFQSEWNQLCFRQLLRICARVPCLEQRRHAGDLGVTHYCRIEGVGSTSHMSWMRNLMWRWSSLHRPGLSALIKSPVVSHHSRLLRFFYYIITPLHWWYLLGRDHSHGWILPRGSCYVLWLLSWTVKSRFHFLPFFPDTCADHLQRSRVSDVPLFWLASPRPPSPGL